VIRVVIVDDHAVVRRGLAELLASEDDIEVVGDASDGADVVSLVNESAADVVLMDLSMPGVDGVAATRLLNDAGVQVQVVVLTSFVDRARVQSALAAGAAGYILKDSDPADVATAVRAAARGESPLDPKVARVVLDAQRAPAQAPQLSPREREVLALVGQGLANKQIARRLGIAERTVKAHLTAVFQAIGVTDRTAAALWADRNLDDQS
jgi:DNA-binding NarL/FixJ family response regulator